MHLNQAGALVHVYSDGSIHLNHGGTEMGQGLYLKVAQVVADEFGVGLDRVKITATTTREGAQHRADGRILRHRPQRQGGAGRGAHDPRPAWPRWPRSTFAIDPSDIVFRAGRAYGGNTSIAFDDLAKRAVLNRVSLSSTGFYRTPKISWNRAEKQGDPFFYFAYGAACSEVTIDTLTGEMKVERVDILHDVGRSLNPAIDIGQIEGGFVQGMGWLTTEELVFDDEGRLLTHAPATYKIPTAGDVPADFRVALFDNDNHEDTIGRSKAVGEPPLMLRDLGVLTLSPTPIHGLAPGSAVDSRRAGDAGGDPQGSPGRTSSGLKKSGCCGDDAAFRQAAVMLASRRAGGSGHRCPRFGDRRRARSVPPWPSARMAASAARSVAAPWNGRRSPRRRPSWPRARRRPSGR